MERRKRIGVEFGEEGGRGTEDELGATIVI